MEDDKAASDSKDAAPSAAPTSGYDEHQVFSVRKLKLTALLFVPCGSNDRPPRVKAPPKTSPPADAKASEGGDAKVALALYRCDCRQVADGIRLYIPGCCAWGEEEESASAAIQPASAGHNVRCGRVSSQVDASAAQWPTAHRRSAERIGRKDPWGRAAAVRWSSARRRRSREARRRSSEYKAAIQGSAADFSSTTFKG